MRKIGDCEVPEHCVFPGALGLNRILRGQTYRADASRDDSGHFSWPEPTRNGYSCNIVILGEPGTGKTTLALELAAKLRIGVDPEVAKRMGIRVDPDLQSGTVLYYSLEQTPSTLITCMKRFEPCTAHCCEGPHAGEATATAAERSTCGSQQRTECDGKRNCPEDWNQVFFPQLSPRRLEQTGEASDDKSIFWRRYEEIRFLIGRLTREDDAAIRNRPLRMVVIDSLNVFGDRPVSRYMIEQLFALFHENGLIGVCVAEDPEAAIKSGTEEPLISPGISNIADVVIKLEWSTEQGYAYRNVDVAKSRNAPNAYGKHRLKLRTEGVEIYPSLHCWYTFFSGSKDKLSSRACQDDSSRLNFGGDWFKDRPLFEKLLKEKTELGPDLPSIMHTVTGPMDTKKTQIALSYALEASRDKVVAENQLRPGKFLVVSFDVSSNLRERAAAFNVSALRSERDTSLVMNPNKGSFDRVKLGDDVVGYQLWLCPGYLLAEELIHFMSQVLMTKSDITRVVFLDIGQIPTRHPALSYQISEHGNLFVVLIELFRRMGVDACFVCTSCEEEKGDVSDRKSGQRFGADPLSRMLQSISHGTIRTQPNGSRPDCVMVTYSGRFAKDGNANCSIQVGINGIRCVGTDSAKPRPQPGRRSSA